MNNFTTTTNAKVTYGLRPLLQLTLTFVICLTITLGGTLLQTRPVFALSPGDIAIIGVRADDIDGTTGNGNDDAIAWVPLANLAPGAEIFFTDAGWTAANAFRTEEGAIKYTAPAGGLAAGTVMLLEFSNSGGNYTFTSSGGGGTYSDADDEINPQTIIGVQPATPGDNFFIFEGSGASPTFIWAWKNDGPFEGDSTSNSTTALPASLTLGTNAISVAPNSEDSWDNSRYVGTTNGTPAQLAADIANPVNWETSESPFSGGNDITNGTLGGGGFTVTGANSAPTITSGNSASVPENGTSAIDVQATDDSDSEGSGLTFSLSGGADSSLFAINAGNGVVTFNSAPDFENPADAGGDNVYNIQVTVTDSGGLTAVQDIVISVTNVVENTAPIITSANSASVPENGMGAIDVNATDDIDVEGSGLTFSLSGGADASLFSINAGDGVVTFNSAPDFENPADAGGDNNYNIQVTVTDSGGLTAVQDIVISLSDVAENTAPTAEAGGPYVVDEGSSVQLDGSGSIDAEQDPATLSYAWDLNNDGNYDDATGINPTFTATDGPASATVSLQVTDDGGLTSTDTATININNVAPTANAGPDQSVFRNETVNLSGTWSDPAGAADNAYTWSWDLDGDGNADASGSANFGESINRTTSFVVDGIATLTFTVTDKDGGSSSDTVQITVVNRAPVADDQNLSTNEDTELSITLNGSDADGDGLSYNLFDMPDNGTLSGIVPNLLYMPDPDFNGSDSLDFQVCDGLTCSDVATVNITVNTVNDAPVALDDTATTDEDTLVTVDVQSNDNGGPADEDQTLTTTAITDPAGGSASINANGTVAYTPDANFNGSDSFGYTVCDSDGACADASVTVLVAMVNDPPVANDDSFDVAEDTPTVLDVAANDSDIDNNLNAASTSVLTQPGNGTLSKNSDGNFTYTPDLNYFGADGFSYQICDSDDICDSASVSINVTAVNDAPVCDGAKPSVSTIWPPNGQFHPVNVSGITDVEGDPITITIDTIFQDEPVDGEADGQGTGADTAQVRAKRDGKGNGRFYHIGFTASDGNGGSCSSTVNVTVPKNMGKKGAAVDEGPLYDSTASVNGANMQSRSVSDIESAPAQQELQLFMPMIANSSR